MDDTKIEQPGKKKEDSLPPGVHVQLTFLSGPERGLVKRLWREVTVIGRSAEADISVTDPAASKQHLEIHFLPSGLVIRDLGSTNGTRVNGLPIKKAPLRNLDEISFGDTRIRVTILEEAAKTEGPSEEIVIEEPALEESTISRQAPGQDPLAAELPPEYTVSLEVVAGPDKGKRFRVKKRAVVIGRDEREAEIVLSDPEVSRRHASLEFVSDRRVLLKDLRSKNGTFHNGTLISVAYLQHGDVITVGGSEIKFSAVLTPRPEPNSTTERRQ